MLGVGSENMGGYWSSNWEDTPKTHSFDDKQVYSKGLPSCYCKLCFVYIVTHYLKSSSYDHVLFNIDISFEKTILSYLAYYFHFKSYLFHTKKTPCLIDMFS